MPSILDTIAEAVGNRPAKNRPSDQAIVIDLLSRVAPTNGGPTSPLPPVTPGPVADFRLVNAIFNFQREMSSRGRIQARFADGRVDPSGKTIKLLNEFANLPRGGGLLIPTDPPRPPQAPPAAPKKDAGFLKSMFSEMRPRPTNLEISGSGSISASLFVGGLVTGNLSIADVRIGGVRNRMNFLGGGLSFGPLPFGVEIAPSSFPSMGSRIHAGLRTTTTTLDLSELTGFCLIIGASVNPGIPAGTNASTILFNIGANRSLDTLAIDLLSNSGPNSAVNFTMDAVRTCRAFASTIGVFAGVSVGVSMMQVFMSLKPEIRKDPDAR